MTQEIKGRLTSSVSVQTPTFTGTVCVVVTAYKELLKVTKSISLVASSTLKSYGS